MAQAAWKSIERAPADTKVAWPLFVVAFAVFLLIALIGQILTMRWRQWLPGAEGERSLIGGVKSAVYTFMSNIP